MNFSKRFEKDRRNARARARVSQILDDDFFKEQSQNFFFCGGVQFFFLNKVRPARRSLLCLIPA